MNDTDFIKVMKESGFTEKEIIDLVFYAQRDSSNLQSDVKELAKRFHRIVFGLAFVAIVMIGSLWDVKLDDGKVFIFFMFVVVYSIILYITPVKFSYKSYRMYKEYMN